MERRAATACCRVQLRDRFLRYTQTSERNLSPPKVCAHCAHGERCACSRCLECLHNLGVYFFLARSLSLSSILSSCTTAWVSALSVDASAHTFPRSLPLRSSSSVSLPQSRTLLGAVAALSLFLSHCFCSPFFLLALFYTRQQDL